MQLSPHKFVLYSIWNKNATSIPGGENPALRLFQQLKCTVRQSFLQPKLPIKTLPLYIKRYGGSNPVSMQVRDISLVVLTTKLFPKIKLILDLGNRLIKIKYETQV